MKNLSYYLNVIFAFFTGFFTDKQGKSSRKAVTLFFCLFLLYTMIISGKVDVDYYGILGAILIIILFCLGAISREQVGKLADKVIEDVDEKK